MSRAWPADTAPPAAATPLPAPAPARSVAAGSPDRPAAARPGTPAPGAAAACRRRAGGRRCAPPCGRCRGPTGRSPRSRRRASPRRRWRTARSAAPPRAARDATAGCPTARAGTAARPRSADRRAPAAGRAARAAAAAPPSRSPRCRCAPAWLLLCAPRMTGSIRLHVAAALAEGDAIAATAAQAHYLGLSCAAGQAIRCCCSTAATASSAPASRPSGAIAPACASSTGRGPRRRNPISGWRSRC